ncbi:H(+)/Cl(-) exchange transporter [Escherichia coli]|nr:H(+)/Cl(-) exchange transporter [Escherichia coli]
MKTDTPSLETPQAARLRRRQLIRQLLERDKTPLAILFMAAVVGTLVGLAAVAFDKGVAWLQNQRMGALVHTADNYPLLLTVAFLCSAVLAMFGYFLVRKYAPEAGGSGIPEIEGGAGRSTSRSLVACIAGEVLWRAGDTRRRHGVGARRANRADRR